MAEQRIDVLIHCWDRVGVAGVGPSPRGKSARAREHDDVFKETTEYRRLVRTD